MMNPSGDKTKNCCSVANIDEMVSQLLGSTDNQRSNESEQTPEEERNIMELGNNAI